MHKKFLIIALVLLVAGLGVYFYKNSHKAKAPSDTTINTQTTPPPTPQNITLEWEVVPQGEDPVTLAPASRVSLVAGERVIDTGTHTGNCSVIEQTSWGLLIGERTGVICWWAGAGTELGVFEENGKLVLKRGVLDEGNEDTPSLRGNFTVLQEL